MTWKLFSANAKHNFMLINTEFCFMTHKKRTTCLLDGTGFLAATALGGTRIPICPSQIQNGAISKRTVCRNKSWQNEELYTNTHTMNYHSVG